VRRPCLSFACPEKRIDALAYLSLDEAATPGGSLELSGDAQVLGAPPPEPPDCLSTDIGAAKGITKVSQNAFEPSKARVLGEPTQCCHCLG